MLLASPPTRLHSFLPPFTPAHTESCSPNTRWPIGDTSDTSKRHTESLSLCSPRFLSLDCCSLLRRRSPLTPTLHTHTQHSRTHTSDGIHHTRQCGADHGRVARHRTWNGARRDGAWRASDHTRPGADGGRGESNAIRHVAATMTCPVVQASTRILRASPAAHSPALTLPLLPFSCCRAGRRVGAAARVRIGSSRIPRMRRHK